MPNGTSLTAVGQKNDPPFAPAGPYLHGAGGLFNRRDIDNQVFSLIMGPLPGVANAIPVVNGALALGGNFGGFDQQFETVLTGVTSGDLDDFSNQPTTDCADGPVGGLLKLCSYVNTYGRYRARVREVSQVRAGRVADRIDNNTLQLLNSAPVLRNILGTPGTTPALAGAIGNEISSRIFEAAFSFSRMFAPRVWTGSPANNNGERRDIMGLELHINQNNKIDATSSAVCTAANSDVKDFGYDLVGGTGRDIVEYIEMCDRYVRWNARKQGFSTVEGIIAMRPELFQEITQVWPVRQYQASLNQMANFANGRVMVDASGAQNQRDAFRNMMILPVNGRNIPVVEDDTMPEDDVTTNANLQAGQYASDISFIPLTVLGGLPVTFWEYFDHGNNQANMIQNLAGGGYTWTTDGGMFRWYADYSKGCLSLNFEFSPRLRMRTPQLAWRIQNVAYQPLQHLRSWNPDSSYFFNGGVTSSPSQSYYAPWSPTTLITP